MSEKQLSYIEKRKLEIQQINNMGERRMQICRSCDHFGEILNRCKQCGCFMPAKSRLPGATCPLQKWLPE